MSAKDFIGIAKEIHGRELSQRQNIERLGKKLDGLKWERSRISSNISLERARLSSAMGQRDENGEPDYSLIASIEAQISTLESKLQTVDADISLTSSELSAEKAEYERTQADKMSTLSEIQRRVSITEKNISKAGTMYGNFANIGLKMQNKLSDNANILSKAANILGGSVTTGTSAGSGGYGNALGGASKRGGVSFGGISVGNRPKTAQGGRGTSSQFSSSQQGQFPSYANSFGSGAQGFPSGKTSLSSSFSSNQKSSSRSSAQKTSGKKSSANLSSVQTSSAKQSSFGKSSSNGKLNLSNFTKVQNYKKSVFQNQSKSVPTAFSQKYFSTSYEKRISKTPGYNNPNVMWDTKSGATRGEGMCIPRNSSGEVARILKSAGVKGIEYKNGVPDFTPVALGEVKISYMMGGKNSKFSTKSRADTYFGNYAQADQKFAEMLNGNPQYAKALGITSANGTAITEEDVKKFRTQNGYSWHELNDCQSMQLVPTVINATFRHVGGVGEINSGYFQNGVDKLNGNFRNKW